MGVGSGACPDLVQVASAACSSVASWSHHFPDACPDARAHERVHARVHAGAIMCKFVRAASATRRVLARAQDLGCTFTKTPNSGGMKGLAFIKDPDGYLIEILPQGPMVTKEVDCAGVRVDSGDGYKDNSK